MRKIAASAACSVVLSIGFGLPAMAQGEWTKCVARHGGQQWNIVNGGFSADVCFKLARRCTGNPNVNARHYSNPVIIRAPYRRCTAIL